jgi:hypothetical protein
MVRLDRLVNVLGGYGLRLVRCPVPRSTELRGVVLHERTDGRGSIGWTSLWEGRVVPRWLGSLISAGSPWCRPP